MDAGAVIFARLNGQTSAAERVYPLLMPQGAVYPVVTYQVLSTSRTHLMGGDAPIQTVRVQIDSWGSTYADAHRLAGEVVTRLSRFRGIVAGVTVHDVLLDNETDLYESDAQARRVSQDFTLFLS